MKTSNDLLCEAKENLCNHGLESTWFELSYQLRVSESSLHHYRTGKAVLPDKHATKLAKFLPYPLTQIMFWLAAERGCKSIEASNAFALIERQMAGRWKEGHRANA